MDHKSSTPLSFRKTRLAPTPSGYLHLGNVFSFALTAALAEKHQARTLLRIDDLDRLRAQPEYIQDIFDTLDFMGIPWHEGPRNLRAFEETWSQVHRLALYQKALEELRERGLLFACDCSRAQILQADPTGAYTGRCRERGLSLDAPEVNWRLRTDADVLLTVKTLEESTTAFLPREQQDFVVRKKDGFPAYQLTSLVDDDHFEIDLIVRGTDLWGSTLAQLYLASVLGIERFMKSTFHHHPLLSAPGGQKLSKSAGDTSVRYLRNTGRTAAEVYKMVGDIAATAHR
jgi:glutamyl/glutaminyl-tRNA synthetase